MLGLLGAACAQSSVASPKTGNATRTANAILAPAAFTVTYCNGQTMSIWEPNAASDAAPAVLFVHGGDLVGGTRLKGGFLAELQPAFNADGFVVASIDYHLKGSAPWPQPIVDAKCAVRYLRANAATYHLDPKRIGAWGSSAGGYLVNLLGTAGPDAGWDTGAYGDQSSAVQAVVDMFGPADFALPDLMTAKHRLAMVGYILGPTPTADEIAAASPAHLAAKGDPPFLILQGDRDTLVPAGQSQALQRALKAAGVPAELVMVKGGSHGLSDAGENPSQTDLEQMITLFFKEHLAQ
jgi:acetyl esterase/lipase